MLLGGIDLGVDGSAFSTLECAAPAAAWMVPLIAEEKRGAPLKWQTKDIKFQRRGHELTLGVGTLRCPMDADGFVTMARVCEVDGKKYAILERSIVTLAWFIYQHCFLYVM